MRSMSLQVELAIITFCFVSSRPHKDARFYRIPLLLKANTTVWHVNLISLTFPVVCFSDEKHKAIKL